MTAKELAEFIYHQESEDYIHLVFEELTPYNRGKRIGTAKAILDKLFENSVEGYVTVEPEPHNRVCVRPSIVNGSWHNQEKLDSWIHEEVIVLKKGKK